MVFFKDPTEFEMAIMQRLWPQILAHIEVIGVELAAEHLNLFSSGVMALRARDIEEIRLTGVIGAAVMLQLPIGEMLRAAITDLPA